MILRHIMRLPTPSPSSNQPCLCSSPNKSGRLSRQVNGFWQFAFASGTVFVCCQRTVPIVTQRTCRVRVFCTDINPVESISESCKTQSHAQPQNAAELDAVFRREFADATTPGKLEKLFASMKRRLENVISVRGDATRY